MEQDAGVREHVYQLRRAKDLMKLGFGTAQAPTRTLPVLKSRRWYPGSFGVTATVMFLLISLGSGFLGYFGGKQLAGQAVPTVAHQRMDRVLLHISEADPEQFSAALDYTRKFLKEHKDSGGWIAVIANAGGLDLLREGGSPFEQQIIALIREHDNVHFIACANSIRQLRRKGVEPVIIENVDSSMPAMDQIIRHVQEGWTYIKVKSLVKV